MGKRREVPTRVTVMERLEVEDEEGRQRRIESVLEKINVDTTRSGGRRPAVGLPKFDFGDRTTFEVKPNSELLSRIQAFLPQMEVSNQVLMQRAQADPRSIDIEHLEEGEERYIEMDLGLGVFEQRGLHSGSGSSTSTNDSSMSGDGDSLDLDLDSDNDDSSDMDQDVAESVSFTAGAFLSQRAKAEERLEDEALGEDGLEEGLEDDEEQEEDWDSDASSEVQIVTSFVPARPTRPLPRRYLNKRRPEIVVLGEAPFGA